MIPDDDLIDLILSASEETQELLLERLFYDLADQAAELDPVCQREELLPLLIAAMETEAGTALLEALLGIESQSLQEYLEESLDELDE